MKISCKAFSIIESQKVQSQTEQLIADKPIINYLRQLQYLFRLRNSKNSFNQNHTKKLQMPNQVQIRIQKLLNILGQLKSRMTYLHAYKLKKMHIKNQPLKIKNIFIDRQNLVDFPQNYDQNLNLKIPSPLNQQYSYVQCAKCISKAKYNEKFSLKAFRHPLVPINLSYQYQNQKQVKKTTKVWFKKNKSKIIQMIVQILNKDKFGVVIIGAVQQDGYMVLKGMNISDKEKESWQKRFKGIYKKNILPKQKRYPYRFVQFIPLVSGQKSQQGLYAIRINCCTTEEFNTHYKMLQTNIDEKLNISDQESIQQCGQSENTNVQLIANYVEKQKLAELTQQNIEQYPHFGMKHILPQEGHRLIYSNSHAILRIKNNQQIKKIQLALKNDKYIKLFSGRDFCQKLINQQTQNIQKTKKSKSNNQKGIKIRQDIYFLEYDFNSKQLKQFHKELNKITLRQVELIQVKKCIQINRCLNKQYQELFNKVLEHRFKQYYGFQKIFNQQKNQYVLKFKDQCMAIFVYCVLEGNLIFI